MAKVKGAGDTGGGSNPAVRSKFDRSHGHGLKAPHMAAKGPVVATSGEGSGHEKARDASPAKGGHKVHHHAPQSLGSNMVDGAGLGAAPNNLQTDAVGK